MKTYLPLRYIVIPLVVAMFSPQQARPDATPMFAGPTPATIRRPGIVNPPTAVPIYRYNNGFSYIVPYAPTLSCWPGGVVMCGVIIPIPSQLPVGASMTLALPSPFKPQTFTVTCLVQNGRLGYQVVDQSQVTCAPLSCEPQSVSICGHDVPVAGGTRLDDSVNIDIPSKILSDAVYGGGTVRAVCRDRGDGIPTYQISDLVAVSCNNFTCPDATLRLCNADIYIRGGAQMGERLRQTLPEPFNADPFTVSCLGSSGRPPTYQLVEVSGVSCTAKAP